MNVVAMYKNVVRGMIEIFGYFLSNDPPMAQKTPDKTANKSPMFNGLLIESFCDRSKKSPTRPMHIDKILAFVILSLSHITPIAVAHNGER